MSGFEVFIILLFFLVPLLGGIRKKGGTGTRPPVPPRSRPRSGTADSVRQRQTDTGRLEAEPHSAAEMVPDDLWAILTGERRSTPIPTRVPEPREREEVARDLPWSQQPAPEPWSAAPGPLDTQTWETEPESIETPTPEAVPASLEYVGSEATSLETPPPPPEERRKAFLLELERTAAPHRARHHDAPLTRALGHGRGLRRAILFAEVLGPPRGLDGF